MTLQLVVEEPISDASQHLLTRAMVAHQTELYGEPRYATVGYFLRDDHGTLRAGLSGRFRWGWLYVEMLWVAEDLRGQGHGSRLLQMAEDFARSRGGVAIQLTTGGERALPFYARHGYDVMGSMSGYPPGSSQYFLRKWLGDATRRVP